MLSKYKEKRKKKRKEKKKESLKLEWIMMMVLDLSGEMRCEENE